MQAVAREFHLSETVFVLPPRAPEASYRVRIFTPLTELPFAGHPSVGAAVTLLRRSGRPPGPLVQECDAGLIPIQVYDDGRATLAGGTPTVGAALDPAPLLAMAGLTGDDFAGPAPRLASCGLECGYLPVHPEAVARATCDAAAAQAAALGQLMVFGWDPGTVTAHARVFAPGLGVTEDPATGSAALGTGRLPGRQRAAAGHRRVVLHAAPGCRNAPTVHPGVHGQRAGRGGRVHHGHRRSRPGGPGRAAGPALRRLTPPWPVAVG